MIFLLLLLIPNNVEAVEAIDITPLTTIQASADIDSSTRIGLLLPLSGKYKEIGKALLDASELALFEQNSNLVLIPIDTKGTESGASQAMEEALQFNVKTILGPLFNNTTRAILKTANANNIKILSFSNDAALSGNGIFLMGFSPSEQIKHVVEYAYDHGIRHFSALLPDNTYGIVVANELIRTLSNHEISPQKIEWYTAANAALSDSIKRIYEKKNDEQIAILIPEGGKMLDIIISRLAKKGLNNIRILGSGEWKKVSKKLQGSWFAAPVQRQSFYIKFTKAFGYKPPKIASIAYDGILSNLKFSQEGIAIRNTNVFEVTSEGLLRDATFCHPERSNSLRSEGSLSC